MNADEEMYADSVPAENSLFDDDDEEINEFRTDNQDYKK